MSGVLPGLFDQLQEPPEITKEVPDKKSPSKFISSVWSFPGSGGDQLYRWYGTLPRPLVERLISLYATPTHRILDPFLGTGTTLDVASDLGIRATGIDSNPLACLAAESRLFGIPDTYQLDVSVNRVASRYLKADGRADVGKFKATFRYSAKWFRDDTLSALLALLLNIAQEGDDRLQRLMFISAAQIIRDVASVDPRCTHHLVTKKKSFIDPLPRWQALVAKNANVVRGQPANKLKCKIIQGDATETEAGLHDFDFALVHPPYLGVIHYNAIHRLATDLLDYTKREIKPSSLSKFNFKHEDLKLADMSTDNSDRYATFVEAVATQMRKLVRRNGRCVVIIGDQRYEGHLRHPFTDFILQFEKHGFLLEEHFIWLLENNGGMHVLRRGHFIDHNYILVFQST